MSFDVEALLRELSPDAPSGEDLSYDPAYLELGRLMQGKPEQQIGDTIVEAEEPNWRDIEKQAVALLSRTRDLRIMVNLTTAMMQNHGPQGLRDGLSLMSESLARHWDSLYPQLDPDDNFDPLERVNIIASIATAPGAFGDPLMFRQRLMKMPLVKSRQIGEISMRDVQVASSGESIPDGSPDLTMIAAAVQDAELEQLIATHQTAQEAMDCVSAIESVLDEKIGSSAAPDLSPVRQDLKSIVNMMQEWLATRGHGEAPGAPEEAGSGGESSGGSGVKTPGELNTPQDVLTTLDKVIAFYEKREPSSPVPFVLSIAKSLVSKPFLEISKRLPPDTVRTIEQVAKNPDD